MRDRGPGFELAAVPADRRGLRESVLGRMERHGGRAAIHTRPGRGHGGRAGDGAVSDVAASPRVVIVDDHALFRAGVRAELDGLVDVVGDAGSVGEAIACVPARARRGPARRADAGRRRRRGDPRRRAAAPGRPLPRPQRLRRARRRDLDHPRRRARLRHQDDLRPGARRRGAPGGRRRRGVLTAPRRLRPRRLRGRRGSAPAAAPADPELDQLTAREREVLRHIARGYLYKEIALRLGISAKTVEAHVSAVLRKLQLSNRHELSRWAVQRGWVE